MGELTGYWLGSRSVEKDIFLSFFPEDSKDIICLLDISIFLSSLYHEYVNSREMKILLMERKDNCVWAIDYPLRKKWKETSYLPSHPEINPRLFKTESENKVIIKYKKNTRKNFVYFVQRKDLLNNM